MNRIIASVLLTLVFQAVSQTIDINLLKGLKIRNIGPAGMSGRITSIDVVLKDMNIMYVGSGSGGLWKSENGGHTWRPIFEHEKTASIGAVAIYQDNPSTIYVGTGEGNPRNSHNSGYGIYKSLDAGKTWQHLGLEKTRQIHRVIIHSNNPDIVWAAAMGSAWAPNPERGIYKTTDGGKTWKQVLKPDNNLSGCADMIIDPSNPNKLLAALWEHQRFPWFFKSGGKGSGIYMSTNGGENWQKLTPESNNIPQGHLGRIGLTFAPSNPNYVYAFIEAEKNAVWRSTDGGYQWQQMSKANDKKAGDRPFYYADIYADVKNENRLYSLATQITSSEDGGKTWQPFAPGNKIHTDHHAWWAHPTNPNILIAGNDGGLVITRDRGQKWIFVDNLPLGQFYHVQVDDQIPYNVYGGMQDNGSWKGPGYTWFAGDIRNLYWQRIGTSDGFDVIPDPVKPDYGYSTGQAGSIYRYHSSTGQVLSIRPAHPKDTFLRFNWNPGMAIDPFDKKTIYYGSQFLLKSSDYGLSWTISSPDLTTNDKNKQKFLVSGGLTRDVTGAEFHTSIISIAPSPVKKGVIWIGTDDGKVQLTTDAGKTWQDLKTPELARDVWVTQIQPSTYQADEAFVVFDDHRRNNWTPLVYHVQRNGTKWNRLVDEKSVWGFALSFVQDHQEPKLMFCGTEFGLYVSFDGAKTWNKWHSGYPTVPTQDMTIQRQADDLVIGTFGRSFWILDNIQVLRDMAKQGADKILASKFKVFQTHDTYLAHKGKPFGYRPGKVGDVLFEGKNKPYGALLTYYTKNLIEKEKLQIDIYNIDNQIIRTLYHKPQLGFNRLAWGLERNGVARMSLNISFLQSEIPKGLPVIPGSYKAVFKYGNQIDSTSFKVITDPRIKTTEADLKAKDEFINILYEQARQGLVITDTLALWKKNLETLKKRIKYMSLDQKELDKTINELLKNITTIQETVVNEPKGLSSRNGKLYYIIYTMSGYLQDTQSPVGQNHRNQIANIRRGVAQLSQAFETFKKDKMLPFRNQIINMDISILD